MSEFDDFLKSLTRSVDNVVPSPEPIVSEESEEKEEVTTSPVVADQPEETEVTEPTTSSEFDDFMKRVNERNQKTVITDTGTETDTNLSPVGGELAIDVTDQTKAAAEPTRDFDFLYGEKPSAGITTNIAASFYDLFNTNKPNATQIERDEANKALEEWQKNADTIYSNALEVDLPEAKLLGLNLTGFTDDELLSDGKIKVHQFINEQGQIESVILPNPNSSAFERIVDQAGRTIFSELYGLVERDDEGNLNLNLTASDSEFSKAVPDLELPMGQQLASDLLVYGVPGVGAYKGGKGTVGAVTGVVKKTDDLIGTSKVANRVRSIGNVTDNALQYIGGSLAVALTEGVLSEEGDRGAIISDEWVKERFTNLDDKQAKDVAMIMDGFIVNGAFDTLLGLGTVGTNFIARKGEGAYGFISKDFVTNKARRSALMNVLTEIDPTLADMPQKELVAAMRNLSNILNANSQSLAVVGQTTKAIDVDTTNALINGAKDYIKVSHRNIIKNMSPDELEVYLKDQSDLMVNRVIGLAQANLDNAGLRQQQASMLDQVGSTFDIEANRINPTGTSFNESVAPDLVATRNEAISTAQAEADRATGEAAKLRADIGRAVENDPFIAELIQDVDPSRFFNDTEYVEALTNLYGDTFVKELRRSFDEVNNAYKAIPNDPVDVPTLKTKISQVFFEAGTLNEVTPDIAPVMASLRRAFKGKIVSATDDLAETTPQAELAMTPQQLLDGLSGDIGYQDLVTLKQELDNVIKNTNNRAVSNALQDLKKHITSTEVGGQAAYVARNGGQAAELVQKADDLYIDTMSKFQNSQTTKSLSDAANVPAYAGSSTRIPEGGSKRGQPDLETRAVNEITPQALSDKTGNQIEQLRFSLSSQLSKGEVNKPFIDLFVARQTDKLAKALRNNDAQTIAEIDTAFDGIITELKNLDAMEFVQELEQAKSRILSVQDELGSSALAADEVAALALQRKAIAENGIVKELLSKYNPNVAATTPTKVVNNALRGSDAGNFVDELFKAIDQLPADKKQASIEATQSMLLRQMRELISSKSFISPSGTRDVQVPKLIDLVNPEASGVIEAVSRAFPDDPYMKETLLSTLGTYSDISMGSRMKVARAQSQTAANLGIRDSISTGILFTFGYMNPTAAAARRLTSGTIADMEKIGKDEYDRIIATILAAPKEFADIARTVSDDLDPSIRKRLADQFFAAANRTAQYEVRVREEEDDQGFLLNTLDKLQSLNPFQ